MDFREGTRFEETIDPETEEKIKIAILPDGIVIKFWTDEELTDI